MGFNQKFPANVKAALLKMCETEAGKRTDISSLDQEIAKKKGVTGKLFVTDFNGFDAEEHLKKGNFNMVFSYYKNLKENQWANHVRQALTAANIMVVDSFKTKKDQYATLWFIFENGALQITALRRGGKGILCATVKEAYQARDESEVQQTKENRRAVLIEQAKAKLTDDELAALGLHR